MKYVLLAIAALSLSKAACAKIGAEMTPQEVAAAVQAGELPESYIRAHQIGLCCMKMCKSDPKDCVYTDNNPENVAAMLWFGFDARLVE